MAITQTITAYTGTVPDRNGQTPTAFNNAADDWLVWLDGLQDDVSAFASEAATTKTSINNAESSAASDKSSAQSSANYLGNWSDRTGAVSVGEAVVHDSAYWIAVAAIADITASEPGVSNDWEQIVPRTIVHEFDASGTWTKPTDAGIVIVEMIGAGGGGSARYGGGGGGYVRRIVPASALQATETVTIGAGGAGTSSSGYYATQGGNTTFSEFVAFGGGRSGYAPSPSDENLANGGGYAFSPDSSGYAADEVGMQHVAADPANVAQFGGGCGASLDRPGAASLCGGGGGGGCDDGLTPGQGAGGPVGNNIASWAAAGGIAGTSSSINGGNGNANPYGINGSGGGGGYGDDESSVGGDGVRGGGGGAGAASGGDGGDGYARIITLLSG